MKKTIMPKNRLFLMAISGCLLLSGPSSWAAPRYLNEPISETQVAVKSFWKTIYSEIDSSRTVIFNRETLGIYAIVLSEHVTHITDSLIHAGHSHETIMIKPGRKEFISAAIERAKCYPFIDDTLNKYGLHPDLKWLPVLESGYLDTMVSVSGARGIWQFMGPTGKRYGLTPATITDPEASTSAAARYLRDLYNEFSDYALALTAYNCGEGLVRRQLGRCSKKNLDGIIPGLGFESRNYYARFLSILAIVKKESD